MTPPTSFSQRSSVPRAASGIASRLASRATLVLIAVAALSSCNDDPLRPQVRTLDAAEALWQASGAGDSYVITQVRECFCASQGGSYAVTVINDSVVGVRNLTTGDEVPEAERAWYRTVSDLFAEVRRSLATSGTLREVEYDRMRGFPTTLSLDPIRNAVDDEIVYRTAFVGTLADVGAFGRSDLR